MKLTKDTPILTSYALGELSRRKMAKVERILKDHPELQEEVNQIREMATRLSQELEAVSASLTDEQRENVLEVSKSSDIEKMPSRYPLVRTVLTWKVAFLFVMAVIVGGISVHIIESPMLSRVRKEVTIAQQENARMKNRLEQYICTGSTADSRNTAASQPPKTEAIKDFDDIPVKSKSGVIVDSYPLESPDLRGGGYRGHHGTAGGNKDFDDIPTKSISPVTVGQYSLSTSEHQEALYGKYTGRGFRGNSQESYQGLAENTFFHVWDSPLSTFGLDVDTASYSNVRRFLQKGTFPPVDAVRIEELINYFRYDYPEPQGNGLFSVAVDVHPCPWEPKHWLARIGLHGKEFADENRPPVNLVFLLDTSGSMNEPNKLPLLVQAMKILTESLTARDRLTIVTYSDQAAMKLPPTPGDQKATIINVLDSLHTDGATNGEGGIRLAYNSALDTFIQGGINRVLLATDGDFNRGIVDTSSLVALIKEGRDANIFLNVLGFGEGNLQDDRLEALADKGNGQYAYIDSFTEARRVLMDQVSGALVPIAKDVKIQVEFNPKRVDAYRLIGYENRQLAAQDFNDDRKDAGEIGAGHTVTALYELAPIGVDYAPPAVDGLKYQQNPAAAAPSSDEAPTAFANELMTVKLRYKHPQGDVSAKVELAVTDEAISSAPDSDYTFAAAVAAFGMKLRQSRYGGYVAMDTLLQWAQEGKGADPDGRRAEFIDLVRTASVLMGGQKN